MPEPKVHIFMDNSNIFISAQDEAKNHDGPGLRASIRLQFDNLINLAIAARPVGSVFVVGSVPPEADEVWQRLEEASGVKPELYERGKFSGGEQGIDQCLQVHMLRATQDNPEPQIAVLLTGDGAGYETKVGFHADLERMHADGWGIEVLSWKTHVKWALKKWATENGVFVALDDYYDSVTFVKGGRFSSPLDLSKRALAKTRLSPAQVAVQKVEQEKQAELDAMRKQLEEMRAAISQKAAGKAKHDKRFARNAR